MFIYYADVDSSQWVESSTNMLNVQVGVVGYGIPYDMANTANLNAKTARDQANTAYFVANSAFIQANSANIIAISAFTKANSSGCFSSGTQMLFVQNTAPTGWTKSTSFNDYTLRVVSGTTGGSGGGTTAFSTVFASRSITGTVGCTTLTVARSEEHTSELQSH